MKQTFKSVLGRMLLNAGEAQPPKWMPGLTLRNSNGDINSSSVGYDFAIRTTTWLRTKSVQQKFYEVPPADYMTVEVGTGAWMEQITTNLEYNMAGDFESGISNINAGKSEVPQVEVGISPITYSIATWAKGYMYSVPELEKAMASNNWDVPKAKTDALKKNWDLGIQETAFIGTKSRATSFPGLLTLGETTKDTATLTGYIYELATDDFQAFVGAILGLFWSNSNGTIMPDTFLLPMDDFLGMVNAPSPVAPFNSKIEYLENALKKGSGNPNFKVQGLAYCMAAYHPDGLNRYMLYKNDPEIVKMDIPVNFTLTSPGTGDNFQWKGVGYGQFTGVQSFRPRGTYYMDWTPA